MGVYKSLGVTAPAPTRFLMYKQLPGNLLYHLLICLRQMVEVFFKSLENCIQ